MVDRLRADIVQLAPKISVLQAHLLRRRPPSPSKRYDRHNFIREQSRPRYLQPRCSFRIEARDALRKRSPSLHIASTTSAKARNLKAQGTTPKRKVSCISFLLLCCVTSVWCRRFARKRRQIRFEFSSPAINHTKRRITRKYANQ